MSPAAYPGQPSSNFYSPASLRLSPTRQSTFISVNHVLVDVKGVCVFFLGNSFSIIRATWPAHLNLLNFTRLTTFGLLYRSSDSLFYLFYHCPFSHIEPYILRRIFLSKILGLLASFFVIVQDSAAYISNGLTSVLYIRIFVFLDRSCDLKWLCSPKYDLLAAIRRFVFSSETGVNV